MKKKRQEALEENLGCKFIRINTTKEGYDADYEASRIQGFISKFKDEQLKKMNKELKELKDEIKKINKSNKIKAFKIDCQKVLLDYKKLKNTQSKTKLRKTGNEIGTTCCLECKTYTHNFKPQELKMTNMI